ncbi:hypothetical protein [Candidatus Mycolicibacterium alkanivorans]|uniref:Transmembrane protein n=1 Tax=Candidatus Mycolicibacterium alkanivorans TaxID=2954114 RepID=A0ABS9YRR7_9MYCO|nr:hypothetical protein [Candidatus Mycolicibacterium alkanivorans]MCI4673518.1 hypothetical protein [Candidatus Mycolicibacterium alkanivorans]
MPERDFIRQIYWIPAVFFGTTAGGVVWAFIARYTILDRNPVLSAGQGWLALSVGCLLVVLAGLALAAWSRLRALRTAGVALIVMAMSGGSVLFVWGTLFVLMLRGG